MQLLKVGQQKISSYKGKVKVRVDPKTVKPQAEAYSEVLAHNFIMFFNDRLKQEYPDLSDIEAKYSFAPVDKKRMYEALKRDKEIVFVVGNEKVGQISTRDLFFLLEYGRKDEGLLPNPILRKAFDAYKPIYRKTVKDELTKKKK